MAVAEPAPRPKDIFKVAQWKWGIDAGSPRWRQIFFDWIFLPFLSLSYKLGIPTPTETIIESDEQGNTRITHRWFEDEGTFDYEEQADAGCLDEHWGYTRLPHGRLMPPGSGQYGYTIFPRKKKGARKWARPKFPFIIKDLQKEEQEQREREQEHQELAECLSQINQVLEPHRR